MKESLTSQTSPPFSPSPLSRRGGRGERSLLGIAFVLFTLALPKEALAPNPTVKGGFQPYQLPLPENCREETFNQLPKYSLNPPADAKDYTNCHRYICGKNFWGESATDICCKSGTISEGTGPYLTYYRQCLRRYPHPKISVEPWYSTQIVVSGDDDECGNYRNYRLEATRAGAPPWPLFSENEKKLLAPQMVGFATQIQYSIDHNDFKRVGGPNIDFRLYAELARDVSLLLANVFDPSYCTGAGARTLPCGCPKSLGNACTAASQLSFKWAPLCNDDSWVQNCPWGLFDGANNTVVILDSLSIDSHRFAVPLVASIVLHQGIHWVNAFYDALRGGKNGTLVEPSTNDVEAAIFPFIARNYTLPGQWTDESTANLSGFVARNYLTAAEESPAGVVLPTLAWGKTGRMRATIQKVLALLPTNSSAARAESMGRYATSYFTFQSLALETQKKVLDMFGSDWRKVEEFLGQQVFSGSTAKMHLEDLYRGKVGGFRGVMGPPASQGALGNAERSGAISSLAPHTFLHGDHMVAATDYKAPGTNDSPNGTLKLPDSGFRATPERTDKKDVGNSEGWAAPDKSTVVPAGVLQWRPPSGSECGTSDASFDFCWDECPALGCGFDRCRGMEAVDLEKSEGGYLSCACSEGNDNCREEYQRREAERASASGSDGGGSQPSCYMEAPCYSKNPGYAGRECGVCVASEATDCKFVWVSSACPPDSDWNQCCPCEYGYKDGQNPYCVMPGVSSSALLSEIAGEPLDDYGEVPEELPDEPGDDPYQPPDPGSGGGGSVTTVEICAVDDICYTNCECTPDNGCLPKDGSLPFSCDSLNGEDTTPPNSSGGDPQDWDYGVDKVEFWGAPIQYNTSPRWAELTCGVEGYRIYSDGKKEWVWMMTTAYNPAYNYVTADCSGSWYLSTWAENTARDYCFPYVGDAACYYGPAGNRCFPVGYNRACSEYCGCFTGDPIRQVSFDDICTNPWTGVYAGHTCYWANSNTCVCEQW